jgi:phage/plasmid-like protein (TIGR03299 family)
MAHQILGNHAAFDLPTWHGVGTYVGEKGFRDSAHVIEAAGIPNYTARPMMYAIDGQSYPVPDRFTINRPRFEEEAGSAPEVTMGTCTNVYEILQPSEAFAAFDPLVAAGLATYTAAGMLRNGATVFVTAKMETAKIRKNRDKQDDTVDLYALLTAGFTGKDGVKLNGSTIRTVCANTEAMALSSGDTVSFIHNSAVKVNLEKAKERLAAMNAGFGEMVSALKLMAKTKATPAIADQIFAEVFPITADDGKRHFVNENKVVKMKALAEGGIGNGMGSVYDLFNGVTEYLDHHAERKNESPAQILESSWFGTRGDRRTVAFDACIKACA